MRRRDREIIEIGECTSLDVLIERLQSLRARLPKSSEAQVQASGDDNFGWRLTVSFFREPTPEEVDLEVRYASLIAGVPRPSKFVARQTRQ